MTVLPMVMPTCICHMMCGTPKEQVQQQRGGGQEAADDKHKNYSEGGPCQQDPF
ncbi:hypothetical protein [Rhodopirellula halodulae]|uniref:hypothetical protein n=1 Tax=Rhodopirellula halodulae TaxID=2894198 RepID=UPI001E3CD4E2|nr:hypothetical protein [Rhodopirellula sp. JC740]